METQKNKAGIMTADAVADFFNNEPVKETVSTETTTIETFFSEDETKEVVENLQEEPVTQTIKEQPEPVTDFYTNMVKELLQDEDWIDMELEMEEGAEPVLLSTLENITPDLYKRIKQAQKEHKEEEFNSKYVSVEGLDDTAKKLIEIKKAGGDVRPLLEVEQELVHPLKGLDFDDERVQEWIVRQKLASQKLHPKTIDAEVARLKEELILDVESLKIKAEVDANYQSQVDAKLKEQQEYNRQLQEEQKEFKSTITKKYRELGLNENLTKKLVDSAAKWDENGLAEVDRLFFNSKADPELFSEVLFLLKDKKAYEEFKGVKVKNATVAATVKKIHSISPKMANNPPAQKPKDKIEEFFGQP